MNFNIVNNGVPIQDAVTQSLQKDVLPASRYGAIASTPAVPNG